MDFNSFIFVFMAGDLKKILEEKTGLHPQDQKLIYKDKERDSASYLDISGVKDRSKILLVEDAAGKAKRVLEMRRNAKMEKAVNSLAHISRDVEKLATKVASNRYLCVVRSFNRLLREIKRFRGFWVLWVQVSALEAISSKGKKVADSDIAALTDKLMAQLLKLDGLAVEGDAKLQRRTQAKVYFND